MKIILFLTATLLLAGCASVPLETARDTAKKFYIQGLLYETDGNLEDAFIMYKKALQQDSDSSFLFGKIGTILLKEKKFKEAEKAFLKAIALNKNEPENFLALGLTYYYMKSYGDAIKYFEKGLKIKDFPSYRMVLCDLYVLTNQYDKALTSYKILIEKFPSNFLLHFNCGLLLVKMNKPEETKKYFLEAIKLQPAFEKSYVELASIYLQQNNTEDALKYYKMATEISPEDPVPYEKMVEIYMKQGNWNQVQSILTKVIKENVNSAMINQIAGFISFQNKQYPEAEIYYKRALMIKETSEIWFNLGVVYDKMNKKNEMEQCIRKAIQIDPKNHLALNYLGYSLLLENKNIDEAFQLIQQAVRLDPDNGAYLDSLGW
ncbi:MAG TPA: tetratricopeptide repeat protein, partial [bacterium]|nr:tetratricopeptide repeat protein [bacterium]